MYFAQAVAAPSISERLSEWATAIMEALGAPGAGLLIALENLFPPIPSEIILPLAGFAASRGDIGLIAAIIWTTIGSVIGALGLYYLGALLGRDRITAIAAKLPLVNHRDISRTEAWFAKHGKSAVFFGRMLPLFRSFISIPAGLERMPLGIFVILTSAGSLIWNSAFIGAGYVLGENWHVVERYVGYLQYAVIAAVAGAIAYFVIPRLRRR